MYLQDMDEVSSSEISDICEVLNDLEKIFPDLLEEEEYSGQNVSTGDVMMYAKGEKDYGSDEAIANTGIVNKTLGIMCFNDVLEAKSHRVPNHRSSHMEVSADNYDEEKHEDLTEYIECRIDEFEPEGDNRNSEISIDGFDEWNR